MMLAQSEAKYVWSIISKQKHYVECCLSRDNALYHYKCIIHITNHHGLEADQMNLCIILTCINNKLYSTKNIVKKYTSELHLCTLLV